MKNVFHRNVIVTFGTTASGHSKIATDSSFRPPRGLTAIQKGLLLGWGQLNVRCEQTWVTRDWAVQDYVDVLCKFPGAS